MISTLKHPRSLLYVNLDRLSVHYHRNPKAWMNSRLFEKILLDMNRHFKVQNKKILLLIDNAPLYFDLNYHLQDKDNTLSLSFTSGLSSISDLGSTSNSSSGFTLRGRGKLNLFFFFKFKSKL